MARTRGSVAIDAERCTGCNICVELCPQHCLELGKEVNSHDYRIAILARAEDCTGCEICGWVCPHWAIDVSGTQGSTANTRGKRYSDVGKCNEVKRNEIDKC